MLFEIEINDELTQPILILRKTKPKFVLRPISVKVNASVSSSLKHLANSREACAVVAEERTMKCVTREPTAQYLYISHPCIVIIIIYADVDMHMQTITELTGSASTLTKYIL